MRLKNLIRGEFLMLFKYGIVFLYLIFALLYIGILFVIPESARDIVVTVLIFTDPAAMGMFFMGAVVLLEKSQRIESSLGVSPITIFEYIMSKCTAFFILGVIVSVILKVFVGGGNVINVCLGVMLSSVLFSLCGLTVGANIKSLNGFMIATVPFEIILFVPSLLYLFGLLKNVVWVLHPGVAAIQLISGKTKHWYAAAIVIALWIIPIYLISKKAVKKSFHSMGGAKL